jgi:glycosyltransferase involved in cell wall biosynthesis
MAVEIIRILKDKGLAQKMGENARNLVKEKFTIERMLGNMENLYKRLLKPKMAFLLSQFPETHETFILREFTALANKGLEFEIFSLKPCKDKVIHPEAVNLMNKTIYIKVHQLMSSLVYIIFHPIKTCKAFCYVLSTYFFNPPELLKALYVFLECLYIARVIKKKSISHIHSHWATIPTTAAVILNKLTEASFSFTAHAWDIFVSQNGLADKISIAKFAVTCTDYNRKFLNNFSKNSKTDKLYLNYHGIDLEKLQMRLDTNPPSQRLNILAIGRLVEQKGFEYLITACDILQNKGIDFRCSIVGSGPLEKKLKLQIENYKLQEKIIFLATKTQEEIKKLFKETTIFIQPSVIAKNGDRDGIPNVILESLAYGVPVIATEVSGIPEAIINAKTGILVKPADPTALANAIEQLWTDKQMQLEFSKNGRDLVQDKFDVYKNAQELAKIFATNGIIN